MKFIHLYSGGQKYWITLLADPTYTLAVLFSEKIFQFVQTVHWRIAQLLI